MRQSIVWERKSALGARGGVERDAVIKSLIYSR
jgi:hypothetical protein